VSATVQQSRFRNGQLREKSPVKRGRRHGVARTWHPNGVLATEQHFTNDLLHGRCCQWDESGKLLGEFVMRHGTGVQRVWHDNGQLKIEVSTVGGHFCGRNRIWLRDGTLLSERFYVNGNQVTPANYAKAAAKDESLPRYPERSARFPTKSRATQQHIHQNFVDGALEKPGGKEARLWFSAGVDAKRARSLGRFHTERSAVKFVESLYAAGAPEVIVPGIYRDKRGNEFADWLLVRLPKSKTTRGQIRKLCSVLRRRSLGVVQPDRDIGESRLYLSME
jgi:hypothetical protein